MAKSLSIMHQAIRWTLWGGLVAFLLILGGLSSTQATVIEVVQGNTLQPADSLQALEVDGLIYASLGDLARVLGAEQVWHPETRQMEFKLNKGELKVTALNPVVLVDGRLYNLPQPVAYREGALWVPMGPFSRMVDDLFTGHLVWDPINRVLRIEDVKLNITSIEIAPKVNGTLITIRTTEKLEVEDNTSPSNWLHLSIFRGILDTVAISSVPGQGLVEEVKAYQFPNSAQISFRLTKKVTRYKVYQKENPNRILVILWESEKKVKVKTSLRGDRLQPNERLAKFDVIVIDPGHGGKDPGAIGPTGLKEKDVVLDIAKRLAWLLRKELGIKVILTREDDTFVPLKARGEIANLKGADLFLSIHTNASRNRRKGGFETYFLSPAKNDEARAVAMRENAALRFELPEGSTEYVSQNDYVLQDILGDMLQVSFLKESEDLAAIIQEELDQRLRMDNLGVDQAGFYVLVGAKMPSVLVEVAFISNPYEEKLLKQRRFRQNIARALYRAIKRFKRKYEGQL